MKSAQHRLTTILALAALVSFAQLTRAQEEKDASKPARPPAGQRERRANPNSFERIAERLKLTAEQKGKVEPIFQEEMTKLREVRQDTTLTTELRRDRVREIRDQYNGKIKPHLTPEQFDQFKKLQEQGAGRGPRPGGAGGQGASTDKADKAEKDKAAKE